MLMPESIRHVYYKAQEFSTQSFQINFVVAQRPARVLDNYFIHSPVTKCVIKEPKTLKL